MQSIRLAVTAATVLAWATPAEALQCLVQERGTTLTSASAAGPIIGKQSQGEWLVGMEGGVFRYFGGRLEPVPGGGENDILFVLEITPMSSGTRLVMTGKGLFQYAGGELTAVPGGSDLGFEEFGLPIDGRWLIRSERGLIEYRNGGLSPVIGGTSREIGPSPVIFGPIEGAWLIATRNGFYRYADGALAAVGGGTIGEIGRVTSVEGPVGRGWLVGSNKGVFLYTAGQLTPVAGGGIAEIGNWLRASGPVGREWLVEGNQRLFSYAGNRLSPVLAPGTGSTLEVYSALSDPVDGGWLVSASDGGLLRYSHGRLSPVGGGEPRALRGVQQFSRPIGGAILVEGYYGVFRYAEGRLTPISSREQAIGQWSRRGERFVSMSSERPWWLAAGENGLFSFAGTRFERVPGSGEGGSGSIEQVTDAVNGRHLVSGSNGLYRYDEKPAIVATPRRGPLPQIESNRPTYVIWDVAGDCAQFATGASFLVGFNDEAPRRAELQYDSGRKQIGLILDAKALPIGQTLQMFATDGDGRPYPISKPVRLEAALSWGTLAILIAKLAAILHTALFLGLILAARWSDRASAMLLHPLSRKIGLWFGFALLFYAPLQRWLLRRWFDKRKQVVERVQLHPLPVTRVKTGSSILSTELAHRLHPTARTWLEGKPGMGKTVIARDIEARFFTEASNLSEAIRKFGYIPLFVRLRDLAGADLKNGDRMWPARVAEAVLGGHGFIVDESAGGDNLNFVAAILKRSGFVLLLDGANEVAWDNAIVSAAAATDRPGFFVTSQTTPDKANTQFDCYVLPETMADSLEPLLKLFLGEEQGGRLYDRLAHSPLIDEIKTGYDARLVESLHSTGAAAFPESRVALYDVIVGNLFAANRAGGSPDRLFEFAWKLWLAGDRQFQGGDVDVPLAHALRDTNMPVVPVARVLDGETMEFRHDQMRGYLAARHILGAVNPLGVLERSEPNWPQMRSEQDLIWQFLSELIIDDALAQRIYRWTLDKPDDRVAMQAALRARVAKSG